MDDYLGSRVLLLNNLLPQGAILGSTAIEKACKAILAFSGNNSRGHLKKAHWNAVKNFDKKLWLSLRSDFLEMNKRVYLLRYTDDLPQNYNIAIAQREYLAELDHTIISLVQGFNAPASGGESGTKLAALIKNRDPRLLSENHVLDRLSKEVFIYSRPQLIYELRVLPSYGPVAVSYVSNHPAKNSGFMRPGYEHREENGTQHFELSHFPMPPEANG